MKKEKILAIGCGGAGMFSLIVASQLKKGKFETTVLSDEPDIYCRCTSTYILSGGAELDDAIQPESMVGDYGVEVVHEKAQSINVHKKQVTTEKGTVFEYDHLVIATGARPAKPPIPGIDLDHVFVVRTSDDMKHIVHGVSTAKQIVVVGAGVIGIEMASALKRDGVEVTLVEYAPTISPRIADPEFAAQIVQHVRVHGITTLFGSTIAEIKEQGEAREVVISREGKTESIMADMVVVATGVVPNIEILEGTPIRKDKRGILVDRRMRTNFSNVYACGDCAVVPSAVNGETAQSTLASLAIQQSKIVGFQIAGFPITYNGSTNAFAFQIMGKEYAAVGLTEEMARRAFKWVVVGKAVTTDIYNDLKDKQPLEVKLIFAGPRMRLVGYEAFGNGVIASAEVASFAVGLHLGMRDLLKFNYISHPSLTPWPFMNPIIMATEDAMGNLMYRVKKFFRRNK